ncbi:hypothetical protein EVAR_78632_1 [Eumeta japonica]|uniref:Uncharacterized protein n=1 Tax=Eumeta variegata TaxID=151549 RepID=A0A4C1U989_EUMVA|nr:hypothetical protein EVAR_78632_1 [Eumeta japonica]
MFGLGGLTSSPCSGHICLPPCAVMCLRSRAGRRSVANYETLEKSNAHVDCIYRPNGTDATCGNKWGESSELSFSTTRRPLPQHVDYESRDVGFRSPTFLTDKTACSVFARRESERTLTRFHVKTVRPTRYHDIPFAARGAVTAIKALANVVPELSLFNFRRMHMPDTPFGIVVATFESAGVYGPSGAADAGKRSRRRRSIVKLCTMTGQGRWRIHVQELKRESVCRLCTSVGELRKYLGDYFNQLSDPYTNAIVTQYLSLAVDELHSGRGFVCALSDL